MLCIFWECTNENKPLLMVPITEVKQLNNGPTSMSGTSSLPYQTSEVASVKFNGKGSNINDWFDKSRIIYSTWSDLTMLHDFNIFLIAGWRSGAVDRRFHINRPYGGRTYMCNWHKDWTSPPLGPATSVSTVSLFKGKRCRLLEYNAVWTSWLNCRIY